MSPHHWHGAACNACSGLRGAIRLWWHARVVGAVHDHEQGEDSAGCQGCDEELRGRYPCRRCRSACTEPGAIAPKDPMSAD